MNNRHSNYLNQYVERGCINFADVHDCYTYRGRPTLNGEVISPEKAQEITAKQRAEEEKRALDVERKNLELIAERERERQKSEVIRRERVVTHLFTGQKPRSRVHILMGIYSPYSEPGTAA